MKTKRVRLNDHDAKMLGFDLKPHDKDRKTARYPLNQKHLDKLKANKKVKVSNNTETKPNDYKEAKFVLSAWNKKGHMMSIDEYCEFYKLPRKDISSYKLVSHTGTPFYNIVFKENVLDIKTEIDFDAIIKKHIKPINDTFVKSYSNTSDFDSLTYSDLHIALETNKDNNSMYADNWNAKEVLKLADLIVEKTLKNQLSDRLYVDDLGDLMDGYNGLTTRGGHELPQNMTNEEAFDCALSFKMRIVDKLYSHYNYIEFNNICNDNHSGSFGYFVNKAFKDIAELKYKNVKVVNHRQFISHYFVNDICFVISHGKDDKALKFGFKPHLDTKQIEKIDQYLKHNNIYQQAKRIIFKKGDSHQCLFDMSGSDDFDYYNYPACSPSSQWIQTNFKKGRKGFVIENFKDLENKINTIFY